MRRVRAAVLCLLASTGCAPPSNIHEAAKKGDLAAVKEFLAADAALAQATDGDNHTMSPLHVAKTKAVAEALLDAGASPNQEAEYSITPLHTQNSAEVIALLVARGADIEKEGGNDGFTPLALAVSKGRVEALRALIQNGANISPKRTPGSYLLMWAVNDGYDDIVKILVDAGADPNGRVPPGATPLHYAVMENEYGMAEAMLLKGADPNQRLGGGAMIASVAFNGSLKFDTKSVAGKTALGVAKSEKMKELLKKHGGQ